MQTNSKLLLNELLVLRHFKHDNMMALYSAHVRGDELWLVLEYVDAGTYRFLQMFDFFLTKITEF